jgi:GT2 family glycosyltransferase
MQQKPDVTLCIINYNGAKHLPDALEAIRDQSWPFAEVLLVDDASDDDSPDRAKAHYPSLRVLRLPQNRGPGAARNAGFEAAAHDLVLFQDNDVRLQADTAARLVHRLQETEGALLVAPRVVYAADPATVQFDSADCHFLGLMATRNADSALEDLDDAAAATTSLVTACFLIRRSRWDGGAPFDETLGFNLEDHDFGVRSCIAGHELWVEPKAMVLHGSGTPGLSYRPGGTPGRPRLYYLTLNRWIVIAKCFSARTLMLLSPALLLFELMQFAWLAGRGDARVWARACRALFGRRREVCRARKIVQGRRRRPDGALLRDARLPLTAASRGGTPQRQLLAAADAVFRGYWRLVRPWV